MEWGLHTFWHAAGASKSSSLMSEDSHSCECIENEEMECAPAFQWQSLYRLFIQLRSPVPIKDAQLVCAENTIAHEEQSLNPLR